MAATMVKPFSCASAIAPANSFANSFSASLSSASLKTISRFALSTMPPLQLECFLHPEHCRVRLVLDLDQLFDGPSSEPRRKKTKEWHLFTSDSLQVRVANQPL